MVKLVKGEILSSTKNIPRTSYQAFIAGNECLVSSDTQFFSDSEDWQNRREWFINKQKPRQIDVIPIEPAVTPLPYYLLFGG